MVQVQDPARDNVYFFHSSDMKKILIVEDDKMLMDLLSTQFGSAKFSVSKAMDGKEGLAKALNEHPDLILLDLLMPVMDGVTMLKHLRKDPWGKKVHVIILTNYSDKERRGTTKKLGYDLYVIKSDHKIKDVVGFVRKTLG